jgi:hypothetical protein
MSRLSCHASAVLNDGRVGKVYLFNTPRTERGKFAKPPQNAFFAQNAPKNFRVFPKFYKKPKKQTCILKKTLL